MCVIASEGLQSLIVSLRGFAKNFFFQKSEITMEVGGWVQVSRIFLCGKLSQNSPEPVLIFGVVYHVYSVCTLLKVVGYYDLSDLSMSVMGFQKKVWMVGWVGGVSSIQVVFGFF